MINPDEARDLRKFYASIQIPMLNSIEADPEAVQKTGLKHRVYLPEEGKADAPLLLLVHGRAGNSQLMWMFTKGLEQVRPVVIAPEAFVEDPLGGFSWWRVEHQDDRELRHEKMLEDIERACAKLEQFIQNAIEYYRLAPKKICAIGFSQGSAVISTLSLRSPKLFSAVGLLAGFVPKVVFENPGYGNVKSAGELPRYFFAHGTKDETISVAIAERSRDYLASRGSTVEFYVDEVNHKIGVQGAKALQRWLTTQLAR